MDILRKSLTPVEFKLSDEGEVTVAFSRFDVLDSDNDVTRSGAMPVGKSVPMSDFGHTSWDGAKPVGKGTISEVGDLGIFSGRFFKTASGREAYETVKEMGELQEWSYGYQVLESNSINFDGKRARELTKLDVFEVSPVLKGAGVGTSTLAIKSASASETLADAVERYLGDSKALTETLRSMADVRAKEGRVLSEANRTRLVTLREALTAVGIDLDDLLAATAPEPKSFDVTAEVLAIEARGLGVLI